MEPEDLPPVQRPGECPECGSTKFTMPVFTWWGGFVGQRYLNYVKCDSCQAAFNSKTGGSVARSVAIYNVVTIAVVIAMLILLFIYRFQRYF